MQSTSAFVYWRTFAALAAVFCVACCAIAGTTRIDAISFVSKMRMRLHPLMTAGAVLSTTPLQTFATGASPNSVATGDINGDGKPDLAIANYGDNTITVLLNTATPGAVSPSFASQQTFAAGTAPQSVAIADINGDGKPDVVVSNDIYPGTISVLLNSTAPNAATASFATPLTFATGGGPCSVTPVDLNGDGKLDLVVANTSDATVSVLLNTTATGATSPSFAVQQTFPVGIFPVSIAAADINMDGEPDLIVVNTADDTLSVLINTTAPEGSAANFYGQQVFATGSNPTSVLAIDINGDGKPDLVVANGNTVSVLVNSNAPGASTLDFAEQEVFATAAYAISSADFNGDGKPDLIVTSFLDGNDEGSAWALVNTTASGAAIASFEAQQTFATGRVPVSVATADLNGDGKPDFAVANFSSNDVSVRLNTSASITIGGYISGNWFNPEQGGHGFQIEATDAIDPATGKPIMVAIWFVYTPDGAGQNWIYAQGTYDQMGSTVTLPAVLNSGASFPPNFASSDITQTAWGNLTFSFTDCSHGTVTWSSPLPGYGMGSMPITRLTKIAGTTCPL